MKTTQLLLTIACVMILSAEQAIAAESPAAIVRPTPVRAIRYAFLEESPKGADGFMPTAEKTVTGDASFQRSETPFVAAQSPAVVLRRSSELTDFFVVKSNRRW